MIDALHADVSRVQEKNAELAQKVATPRRRVVGLLNTDLETVCDAAGP
jgi:hypothetical protein